MPVEPLQKKINTYPSIVSEERTQLKGPQRRFFQECERKGAESNLPEQSERRHVHARLRTVSACDSRSMCYRSLVVEHRSAPRVLLLPLLWTGLREQGQSETQVPTVSDTIASSRFQVLHLDVGSTGYATAIPYALSAAVKIVAGPISDRSTCVSERIRIIIFGCLSQGCMAVCFLVLALVSWKMAKLFPLPLAISPACC